MNEATLLVIGDENMVFGFGLLGIDGRIVHTAEEAQRTLDQAVSEPEAEIILVATEWADILRQRMDALMSASLRPIVLEIPSSTPDETGRTDLRGLLQHTLGVQPEP